jgi:two-component system sporulation sensor kinase B
LKNKEAIEKLEVEKEVKSWANGINSEEFKKWYQKIMIDFAGDENGNNIKLEFRNEVKREASSYICKKGTILKHNIDFILEECAYACAFLNNVVMVYPGKPTISVEMSMNANNMKFFHLDYKISEASSKKNKDLTGEKLDIIDKEISLFMKEKVTNVNFFVVDTKGNPIYINDALNKNVGESNTKSLSNEAWKSTLQVIRECKERTVEEKYDDKTYLSIKSPLIINNKVEGVIGLSIDITDRKKKEDAEKREIELLNILKTKEELYKVAKYVAHDLAQPVTVLKGFLDLNKSLSGEEKRIFKEVARSIENIADRLLIKYRGVKDIKEMSYISINWCLDKIINQKEHITGQREIRFKTSFNCKEQVFIRGNFIDFNRMLLNLLNNAVEAIEGKEGKIEVREIVKGEEVEIRVKDNGKGMSREMAEKIERGEKVGTMKKEGHGLGTQQINSAVREMKGKIKVESKEGEGTEIILTFPKVEKPRWFEDKIEIKKGEEVVIWMTS